MKVWLLMNYKSFGKVNMQHKFYVKDIPDLFSTWQWIKQNTDIVQLASGMTPSVDATHLINLKHSFDINKLATATMDSLDRFGFYGWRTDTSDANDYGGMSLAYNPDYIEDCNPNQQTLGTSKNNNNEFFYGQVGKFKSIRNSYFDTYAFRHYPPCVSETGLCDFLDGFKRSAVRGRVAVINSKFVPKEKRDAFGWHKDETVFENLRINIPIKTDNTYMFQLKGQQPEHLVYGNMYSWDTFLPHRVFPTTTNPTRRVHLVLGFSPWFDYIKEEDVWISNEFFGVMHPIDMLVNGHIHESINGLNISSL